jgi:hypothetical protein
MSLFCQHCAVTPPIAKPEATHSDIQEILRKRREMLNRVKADLQRVGKLQNEFWSDRKSDGTLPNGGETPPRESIEGI